MKKSERNFERRTPASENGAGFFGVPWPELCRRQRSAFSVFLFCLSSLLSPAYAQTTQPSAAGAVDFQNVALGDVFQSFRERTGLNLAIDWNAIQTLGVDKTTPVTMTAHGLTAGKTLALILDSAAPNHALTYYVDHGIVHITTQAVADQDMITRVFPIEDLLVQHEDFTQIPFIDVANQTTATVGGGSTQSPIQSAGQPNPQEVQAQRQKTIDSIISAITSSVRPEIWKQNGGTASITYFNGNLIVTAPRSVLSSVGRAVGQ